MTPLVFHELNWRETIRFVLWQGPAREVANTKEFVIGRKRIRTMLTSHPKE